MIVTFGDVIEILESSFSVLESWGNRGRMVAVLFSICAANCTYIHVLLRSMRKAPHGEKSVDARNAAATLEWMVHLDWLRVISCF